jgi:predicted Co/Zn/Cd cation transporter (cation efflux family)
MSDHRSPWPEDPPAERASAITDDRDDQPDRTDRPAGSRGVAITVTLASFGFGVALPVLVVVGVYAMITVYAIVKAVGSAPDQPNAVAIALGIVGLVTVFVVIITAAISLIGRAADPKRRH